MHRFERAHEIPELGAPLPPPPSVYSHVPLINEPTPRWRDPKDRPASTMSFATVDSRRALRGSMPPVLTSFISAGPSLSSSSAAASDSVAPRDQRDDERDRGFVGGRFKAEARPPQLQQQHARYLSSLDRGGLARPHEHALRGRNAPLLYHHRPVQSDLSRRVRDYDETESDESESSSREHGHQRLRLITSSNNSTSRDSASYALYRSEHSFVSSPLAPLSSVSPPPPPTGSAATTGGVTTGELEQASSSVRQPHKPATRGRRKGLTPEEKRKARTCIVDGCNNYIVHRHRCFRHGGGKRCSVEGCNTSAKQRGLCWRHGGSIICKIDGCTRGVKSKGLCWSHGEGKKLQDDAAESPETVYYCIFDGCYNAPVLSSFCGVHSRVVTQPGYVYEL